MEECKEENCCKKTSVTEEQVNDAIASEEYMTVGKKTTLCLITLKNGYEVVGTSACVDVNNYDIEIGKPYARQRAIEFVWMHLASILQQELMNKTPSEIAEERMDGAAA